MLEQLEPIDPSLIQLPVDSIPAISHIAFTARIPLHCKWVFICCSECKVDEDALQGKT
jgi:hypothetical protein